MNLTRDLVSLLDSRVTDDGIGFLVLGYINSRMIACWIVVIEKISKQSPAVRSEKIHTCITVLKGKRNS